MALEKLSDTEKEIVFSCIRAIANGPFIKSDWELRTRLGVDRSVLDKMIEIWPEIDDSVKGSDEALALNNTMNEVCHGVRFSKSDWVAWFNVDRDAIKAVYRKWCLILGEKSTGIM